MIRDFRSDEEGVASTVGTIMALLVFLTFLSLIVNQYVPVWMKDSEAAHMNSALGQMGGLKGAIDLQMLAAQSAKNAGVFYIPVTTATAISLGVDGVPIFSASTIGTLNSFPDGSPPCSPTLKQTIGVSCGFSVQFSYLINNNQRTSVSEVSNGTVQLSVQNRYYIPQTVVYENDAVIRLQTDGQVIRANPVFSVVKSTNNSLAISLGLVSLYGTGAVSGTSTEIVNTQLFAFDRQDYPCTACPASSAKFASDARIWINNTSPYAASWYSFMNQTLANTIKPTSWSFTGSPLDQVFTGKVGGTPVYRVELKAYANQVGVYTAYLTFFNQSFLPLAVFHLQHAHVQVGVGQALTNVQF